MTKTYLSSIVGFFGGTIASLIGGWDTITQTLVIFMIIDYLTGLMVAGIFKKSQKTETGGLQSGAGFRGFCKKAVIMLIVIVAHRLDIITNASIIRYYVVIGLICNEGLSILENAKLMGIDVPKQIRQALENINRKDGK